MLDVPLRDRDEYLRQHGDRLLASLIEFIRIPSVSTAGADMEPAVAFLLRELKACGFASEVISTGGNPVVYAEAGGSTSEHEVLLYGHYDVFPADRDDEWRTPPFEGTVIDDRIYGRGAGDNKGQLLAHIAAVGMLRELAGELPVKVKLMIEGEEEIGSRHLPTVVMDNRDRFSADLCFYSDGPMFPGDQPIVLVGVRGIVVMDLVATGANRAVHSGNFGGVTPTPAMDLCRLLSSMVDERGDIVVPGVCAGVPEVSDSEHDAIAQLPDPLPGFRRELGVEPLSTDAADYYERLLLRPYLNLAGIAAGWAGSGVRPTIPNEARAKVEVRLVGDQGPEGVVAAVRRHVRRSGFDNVAVHEVVGQPASKTSLDHPLAPLVRSAVQCGFGVEPLLVPSLAATTPEFVFTKLLGLPAFGVPYAPFDESNHAPNECTRISLFLGGVRTTAALLLALGNRRA